MLRLVARLLDANTSADTEDTPLVPPDPRSLGWLRRGGQLVRQALGSAPAHLPSGPLPDLAEYAADSWEDPAGIGVSGWSGLPTHPFDRPPAGASSLLNLLWSAYLMGRPLQGVARQVWPQVQRIGGQRLLAAGTAAAGAVALAELVVRWQQTAQRGTPQGGALSPLLANIYLHPFDVALTSQGVRLVRFMDDCVVLCASEAEAQRTLTLVEQQLATFRLQLNPGKTRIVNYADGLEFLGQALVPRRRSPRWIDGARTFEEAQERLRASARQVRRKLKG